MDLLFDLVISRGFVVLSRLLHLDFKFDLVITLEFVACSSYYTWICCL